MSSHKAKFKPKLAKEYAYPTALPTDNWTTEKNNEGIIE
jgi:hypothetical protein